MKKAIFILSFLSTMLFMTSCLDDKNNSYTDATFVYVDRADDGTAFGKKISSMGVYGNMTIVCPEIKGEDVGNIKVMTYSWDESYGVQNLTKNGEEFVADKVVANGKTVTVEKTILNTTQLPEMEEHNSVLEITHPIYADNKIYMNDYWIFQYAYKASKDQNGKLYFYLREIDPENPNKIDIDIDLVIEGAKSDKDETESKGDAIAVDMKPLRAMLEQGGSTEKKEVEVQFHYYKDNEPQNSSRTYKLTIGE